MDLRDALERTDDAIFPSAIPLESGSPRVTLGLYLYRALDPGLYHFHGRSYVGILVFFVHRLRDCEPSEVGWLDQLHPFDSRRFVLAFAGCHVQVCSDCTASWTYH